MVNLRKTLFIGLGGLIGLTSGYFYWQEIGCSSGTCPITSNPLHASIYGAIMGSLFFSILYDYKK